MKKIIILLILLVVALHYFGLSKLDSRASLLKWDWTKINTSKNNEEYGEDCNCWNRYPEDCKLLKSKYINS